MLTIHNGYFVLKPSKNEWMNNWLYFEVMLEPLGKQTGRKNNFVIREKWGTSWAEPKLRHLFSVYFTPNSRFPVPVTDFWLPGAFSTQSPQEIPSEPQYDILCVHRDLHKVGTYCLSNSNNRQVSLFYSATTFYFYPDLKFRTVVTRALGGGGDILL